MFKRLSSSLQPQDAICAFAGDALPHTILSCCQGTLLSMFSTRTVLSLRTPRQQWLPTPGRTGRR